ncbi:MAG: M1 family metallopeptidase, partial [Anaerolineales bacterium]|nr:M1 family metallopeptidase [Anaerolineales bacterium]
EDKPLNEIYFQLFPNAAGGKSVLSSVSVDGQAVNPVYEFQESAARINLPTPLPPGKQVVVQKDFQVQFATKMEINYGLFGYFEGVLVLDSFYPAIPVYDQTGWNVQFPPPNADTSFFDASFYVVRVNAPEKLVIVASGTRINQTREGNRQIVTFAAGPARDFYLAASERFIVVSDTLGETTINSYAFAERKPGAQSALKIAKDALKIFNARLGEYPYTEFDVVSTPMLALGIEYPGLVGITLREYDPNEKISGLSSQVFLESTVAHEVVHQWFYNLVGNDQIDEPWLDESLTQYVTGLYYFDLYGESGAQTYRNNNWAARWNRLNRAPIPIGLPASAYKANEYSPIVYGRGPYFVQALAEKMGQATFDKFLREYTQTHKWGIGTTASFKQIAERNCQCDLTPLFNEWVYRK